MTTTYLTMLCEIAVGYTIQLGWVLSRDAGVSWAISPFIIWRFGLFDDHWVGRRNGLRIRFVPEMDCWRRVEVFKCSWHCV
jgi:hypothetical protein